MFRPLKADEIDCRVSTINEKGLSLLLYKDARVDQNILDETFGLFGWQRSHQLIGDRLYCTVSIKNPETGEWISKQDVGTESYTEKEKGQASDSFKRACFNLGIGRELYTAPFIWINAGMYKVSKNKNGQPTTYDRFEVDDIEIRGGKIVYLRIVNASNKRAVVFESGKRQTAPASQQPAIQQEATVPQQATPQQPPVAQRDPNEKITAKMALNLRMMCKRHYEMPEEKIYGMYGRNSLEDMTVADWVAFGQEGKGVLEEWDLQHQQQ